MLESSATREGTRCFYQNLLDVVTTEPTKNFMDLSATPVENSRGRKLCGVAKVRIWPGMTKDRREKSFYGDLTGWLMERYDIVFAAKVF